MFDENSTQSSLEKNKKRNFTSRCQKNPFMKRYVLNRDRRLCFFCHKVIFNDTFVLHHLDYENSCVFGDVIKFHLPTLKRPKRLRKLPDCETCYVQFYNEFKKCSSLLVSAHCSCHGSYHKKILNEKLNNN